MTTYELWDTDSSNLVGTYTTEEAALAIVRDSVVKHGPNVFRTIALGREDEQGELVPVAQGEELVRLAMSVGRKSSTSSRHASAAR